VKRRLTVKYLEKLKVPKVFFVGLLLSAALGLSGWGKLKEVKNYYQIKQIFPEKTYMVEVLDGDTFVIENGLSVRLLGIDAPARGKKGYQEAKDYFIYLVKGKGINFGV